MSQAILECPLCQNEFNTYERTPKILSCGHTVCLSCIDFLDQPSGPNCCSKNKLTDIINKDNLQTNDFFLEMIRRAASNYQSEEYSQHDYSYEMSQQFASPQKQTTQLVSINQNQFLNSTKISKISEHLQILQQDLENQRNSSLNSLDRRISDLENLLQEKQSHHAIKFESTNSVLQKLQKQSEDHLQQINFYFQQNQEQQEFNSNFLKEFDEQDKKIQNLERVLRDIQKQNVDMSQSELKLEEELLKLSNEKEYLESKYSQQVLTLTNKTNQSYIKMQELQKTVEDMQSKLSQTKQELDEQKLDNSQSKMTIEQQQEYIQQLSQNNQLLKQYQIDKIQNITSSQDILEEQINQNQRLKEQIQFLKKEIDKISKVKPLTKELQNENENIQQRIQQKLKYPDKLNQLQVELLQLKDQFKLFKNEDFQNESEIQNYKEKLDNIHIQMDDIQNDNQCLLGFVQDLEQLKVKCVCSQLQQENESLKKKQKSISTGKINYDFNDYIDNKEQMIVLQHQQINSREIPLSETKLFALFYQAFDKKFKNDQEDIITGLRPQYFTNFFCVMLQQQNSSIEQVILKLKELYTQDQKYGVLLCRFLHLFHTRPFDLVLSVFLIKIRSDFKRLIESYNKRQELQAQKNKAPMPELQREFGGSASLIDIFILINTFFDQDKQLSAQITNQLLPIKKRVDFLMYIIIWKMTRHGKAPSQIFQMIDKNKNGRLDHDEFKYGINTQMQMYFTEEELDILMNYLDADGSGTIEYQEFVDKINQLYTKKINKDTWVLTFADFQNAIAEAYIQRQQQDFTKVQILFIECDLDQDGLLDQTEFFNFIQKLDQNSQIDSRKLQQIFKEALKLSESQIGVAINPLIFITWKYAIGNVVGKAFEAEQILSDAGRNQNMYSDRGVYKGVGKINL